MSSIQIYTQTKEKQKEGSNKHFFLSATSHQNSSLKKETQKGGVRKERKQYRGSHTLIFFYFSASLLSLLKQRISKVRQTKGSPHHVAATRVNTVVSPWKKERHMEEQHTQKQATKKQSRAKHTEACAQKDKAILETTACEKGRKGGEGMRVEIDR